MTNPYITRVQQKLAHSSYLLDQARQVRDDQPQAQRALLESSALALAIAARLYLRELGHLLAEREPERIYNLADFTSSNQHNGLLQELAQSSWLSALLRMESKILSPQVATGVPAGLIAGSETSSITGAYDDLTASLVGQWLAGLREHSERQRASQLEY
ncbi:DUF6586 family protein [Pseudomaricurvus sp. HS19]|uniref:DUF6586 family protein n=1 Tax=Pseudomaricurvus sp. HS19 TaxID=2692626 RepID=UPI00136CC441|nr:DUF6586 family protein [Pseudomaricurvus sp. HS19]MYM62123.1 hypothetical protein [Pseudomaricurvus sp. HS19]